MHPVLDEILRAKLPIRPDVFGRWQRAIRTEIAPKLDAADQIIDSNEAQAQAVNRRKTKDA